MQGPVTQKWRPPLWFVLAGTVAVIFAIPVVIIGYLRVAGGVIDRSETAFLLMGVSLIATLVMGYLLWRLVLRPVRSLTAYARSVAADRDAIPPPHFVGTPEFSELIRAVQRMSRVLQGREMVMRSYADHVTHELRSPLTVVQGAAELLNDPDLAPEDRTRLLANVADATDRMQDLLAAQRALAKAHEPMPPGRVRLSAALPESPLSVRVEQDGMIPLPEALLRVVLTHLLGNAQDHGAGTVVLSAKGRALEVRDDGPGVSPGNRARIFDPFFTTRRESGGTGMGLAIVQRMLETQGATIELTPASPGAAFLIRW